MARGKADKKAQSQGGLQGRPIVGVRHVDANKKSRTPTFGTESCIFQVMIRIFSGRASLEEPLATLFKRIGISGIAGWGVGTIWRGGGGADIGRDFGTRGTTCSDE
jgi:hypothetical protein